ncbi:MAG: tetratricopeptide repeat protein [Bacteroidales bacterium]|nr:tetratricopeptide repeat protein [Bacteroidales bacterium]
MPGITRKKILFFISLVLLFAACSTKKDAFLNRAYHNLSAHYNAYFNGKESYKEGVNDISKAHQDDYSKVLPVFRYGSEQNAQAAASKMDRAISKASVVIKRHSMFIKKEERCKWIDDSYMLVGKANFYKQNYSVAAQTFEFIIARFKKEPSKYDAALWLARSYIQSGKFSKAQSQLDMVKNAIVKTGASANLISKIKSTFKEPEIPLNVFKELPLIYADFHIKQENYTPAVEQLRKGIELNKRKKTRARLNFILAQIYQLNGDLQKATDFYYKTLRLNPAYEMAFNCRMNMAKCYDEGNVNSRNIKKDLLKMTKDIKNKEYLDQIYYALAEIALKEKNTKEALKYLKLSAAKSQNNNKQKALTYLLIADIYFSFPDYINSQIYYDSTMTVLPKEFPDYSNIEAKKKLLTDLVFNIKIVHFEDSVQTVAKMSEKDRNALIDKIIAEYIKKEEEKKQAEYNKQINQAYYTDNQQNNQQGGQGLWYFYNPNTIKFGINEFLKIWGMRQLEDNWRLSDKKVSDMAMNDSKEGASDKDSSALDSLKQSSDPRNRKTYLQNLPLTKEQTNISNKKIEEALYNLGFLYQDPLKEYDKSVDAFEQLIKRFPDTEHLLSSYYQLYKVYSENLKNPSKADYYKNLIITKFPDSEYAKHLKDPNYAQSIKEESNAEALKYKESYLAYKEAAYSKVIENSNNALMSFKNKDLFPKFALLKALAVCKSSDKDACRSALKEVISNYPNSQAKNEAQNILDYIDGVKPKEEISTEKKDNKPKTPEYSPEPETIHFYILIADVKSVNIKDVKIAISDFNLEQYSLEKFNVNSSFLGSDLHIITVSNFENKEKAMKYFNHIKSDPDFKADMENITYQHFIISANNYTLLFKNRDVEKYNIFFEENYLK